MHMASGQRPALGGEELAAPAMATVPDLELESVGGRREHSRGQRQTTTRYAQKHAAEASTVLLRDEGCLV